MTPDEDPGWPVGLSMFAFLVPGLALRQARRASGEHGLRTLRRVFLTFSTAVVMFGVVLPFLSIRRSAVLPWLAILAAMAVVSVVATGVTEKPLDCSSDVLLAGSYRTRFFLRIAFAESVALFGFVFAFIGAGIWIYYVGAAFALFRFWTHAAPTRTAIARDQEQLNASGCSRSLVGALRGSGAPGTGTGTGTV